MSEKRKRNSYSPEFKAKVGLEAILDQAGMLFEGK